MYARYKQIIILLSLFIFIIFFGSSCYTTFKHPEIYSNSDSTETYHSKDINFAEDCSSCHVQDDPINDSHLQVYDYPLYQDNYKWDYYYVIPWWVDNYYYQDHHLAKQKDILPAPERRDFDRREIPASAATPSAATSGATLSKPNSNETTPASSSSEPQPQKRNERREIVPRDKTDSKQATPTAPERKKREDQKTKKEKE